MAMFASVYAVAQETDAQKAAMNAAQAINNTAVAEPAPVKPNYWTNSITFDLGLNQTWMSEWAAGGYPTVSLAAGIDGKALYERGRASWNNRAQLNYGLLWSADKINLIQNSNDRIYLESKFDYKMTDQSKWRYSAGLDFKTQFGNTLDNYRQEDPANPKSKWLGDVKARFFAPAYLNLALGVDWKPNNWFDMSVAPLTGSAVIVTAENRLRKSYGMDAIEGTDYIEEDGTAMCNYKPVRFQLGAQVKANAKVNVNDWFNYETQVVFFGNYLGKEIHKYEDKDGERYTTHDWYRVSWDNKISFNVAKYFKVGLQTWLVYDPSVVYKYPTSHKNYDPANSDTWQKARPVQFKEFFSINFTYLIAGKKK